MSKKTAATSSSKDNDSKKKPDNNAHSPHYLMWFRRDLRIHDNTALAAICEQANASEAPVTAVYFITPEQWLEHDDSLVQVDHIARTLPILAQKLEDQLNIALNVYLCADFDKSVEAITELCAEQKNYYRYGQSRVRRQ